MPADIRNKEVYSSVEEIMVIAEKTKLHSCYPDKGKPLARAGRKGTGLMELAGLPGKTNLFSHVRK